MAEELNVPDQPDGITSDSFDLPAPANAAKRVAEYLEWWGDGLVDTAGPNAGNPPAPLYARDLQALVNNAWDRDLLLWLHAEAAHLNQWHLRMGQIQQRWVHEDRAEVERLTAEWTRVEASRQAWAEEAMRQSSELNDYADLLLTCAESPSPEHLARVLRRMAARRPQPCPFVSDSGNCCEGDEGHDGPHLRWFDEIRYEVLAASTACACVSDEQAAVIVAGGFSRPQCAVHPEAGGE